MAEKKTPETEAELTEVLRVRREKLAQLVEDGKDPFQIKTILTRLRAKKLWWPAV